MNYLFIFIHSKSDPTFFESDPDLDKKKITTTRTAFFCEKEKREKEERVKVVVIAVLPQEGPLITGEEKIYASGDILGLNCTSGKSHPASTFKWFINGKQVREWRKLGREETVETGIPRLPFRIGRGGGGGRRERGRVERELHSLPRSKVIDRLWRGESVQRIDEA